MIHYRKALEMCIYENFASWSWTLFPVPSYTLLILGWLYYDWCVRVFGYSMEHLCKRFRHTFLPIPLAPLPVHRVNLGSQRWKENFKDVFLKIGNRPITNIFTGFQLNVVNFSTLVKDTIKYYLGSKPPKFAIYEILSLLFS